MTSPNDAFIVSSRVQGNIAWYDIYARPLSGMNTRLWNGLIRTTRYSELHQLHKAVMKEVPHFQGRLPRKTLIRNTAAAFVESRRCKIQSYLHMMATDTAASQCQAFKDFFFAFSDLAE